MKNEEHELEKLRAQLEEQPIPENALDEAIFAGFNKARSKHKRKRRSISLSTVAFIFLISFATSVRVSSTFANTMASIPGFSAIIEMIQTDKGMKDIVENEYFEELNIEAIKDDITFTLLGVVADESGMVITYRIEAPFDLQKTDTKRITIYQNGKELEVAYGYNLFPNEPTYQLENQVEIIAPNPLNYDSPNFEFQLIMDNPEQTTFNIPFTLTKEIQKSLTYPIEQTIEIDGQKLTVHKLTISPLRAGITLSPDEGNTMQILSIEHIRLMDENREEWGSITNGVSSFGGNYDSSRTLFIQSNYFRTPKELHLKLERIQALQKGENFIEIDFIKQEIVSQPTNWPITFSHITSHSFKAEIAKSSKSFHHGLFGKAIDANGQTLESSGYSMLDGDDYQIYEPRYETANIANPVKIYFESFPNYLDGSATVKIELE